MLMLICLFLLTVFLSSGVFVILKLAILYMALLMDSLIGISLETKIV